MKNFTGKYLLGKCETKLVKCARFIVFEYRAEIWGWRHHTVTSFHRTQMSVALHSGFFTERMWHSHDRFRGVTAVQISVSKSVVISARFLFVWKFVCTARNTYVWGAHNIPKCIVHACHMRYVLERGKNITFCLCWNLVWWNVDVQMWETIVIHITCFLLGTHKTSATTTNRHN